MAAADDDRTMLFGATLTIQEPAPDSSPQERSSARSGQAHPNP